MESKIMKDNMLYLQEWKKYNPGFMDTIFIEDDCLICKIDGSVKKVTIKDFYLPTILYNETLRVSMTDDTLKPEDLFSIISVDAKASKLKNKEQNDLTKYPTIVNIIRQENGLIIIDENNQKYRYETNDQDRFLQLFGLLKANKNTVSIKDLTEALKHKETDDLITYEEYTTLIQNPFLTELQRKSILDFENFILQIKLYAPYLNFEALELLRNYQNFYQQAFNLPNLAPTLQEGIKRFQKIDNTLSILEEKEKKREKEDALLLERKLKDEKKAGYTNGIALLFVVFNLGMFLACLLLFFN